MKNKLHKRELLGFGLNNDDGHVRMTKGENFFVHGGSQKTHSSISQKIQKFNRLLAERGTNLNDAPDAVISEVAQLAGFQCLKKIRTE
jgi:hypothetical protein